MKAIVTCDSNFAISYKGKDFVSIPAETKTRMNEIAGKTIIYDGEYLKSLPGQRPVAGCKNIIYSTRNDFTIRGAEVFYDLDSLKTFVAKESSNEVYIIHGGELYKTFFDEIDTVHMTIIDYEYAADQWFENMDRNEDFELTADSDELYCFDIVYRFVRYERKK